MLKGVIVLLVTLISGLTGFSQSFYSSKKDMAFLATGGLGTSTYYGELANSSEYINAQPNINVGLQYYLTNRISARTELNWFTLAGDDKKSAIGTSREGRNLSFRSSNFEVSAVGIVDLFAHGNRYYRRPSINFYGFAGIGLLYFNPKAQYTDGNWYSLQPLKTEGVSYSLVTPVIPYGFGARFKLTPRFNLSIEAGFRKTFTDYLDDISTTYPGTATFTDPIAAYFSDRRTDPTVNGTAGGIRGNSSNLDSYMLLNAKIEYYLPWEFSLNQKARGYSKKRKSFSHYKKNGRLKKK